MMCNMLIWINGPFGVGKTHTAFELHRRLPGSFVCDPEHHGFALFKTIPPSLRGDFQDLPIWRKTTFETLRYLAEHHAGPVIVPMTLVQPAYFEEIVGRLKQEGHDVRHFALLASRDTLLRRLRTRGDLVSSWPAQQIDRCLHALQDPLFAGHLNTEHKSIPELAEHIAGCCGLDLQPRLSGMAATLYRWKVTLGHVR